MIRGERERMHPDFRIIAIVSESPAARNVMERALQFPEVPIGIMLRDPSHNPQIVRSLAISLQSETIPSNVRIIVNGCTVDGVNLCHLTTHELIEGVQPAGSFGVSTHSLEEAFLAETSGASYITFSPVFRTRSKPESHPVGLGGLQECCARIDLPVFALGGITSVEKVHASLLSGAWGVAGISFALEENIFEEIVIALQRDGK